MSIYKLLSNTPTTFYCPSELQNIYRVFEKHPELPNISICCGSRISNRFMLTEKVCIKKFEPQYIKVQQCNQIIKYIAQEIYTPHFEDAINGVLLIEINGLPNNYFTETNFVFEKNHHLWEKKQCTIFGTSIKSSHRMSTNYYEKWITLSNNTITVQNVVEGNDKWLYPDRCGVQFCEEDIGCPMLCDNKLIGIASQRYNWRTWAMNMDCGNVDVETRYLFLNLKYVNWINKVIGENV